MKTLIKHIEIEFKARTLETDNLTLRLSNSSKGSFGSIKLVARGVLIGSLGKLLKTQIIFYNKRSTK